MSKLRRVILFITAVCAIILHLFNNSAAQKLSATLKIDSVQPPILSVEGKVLSEKTDKNWTFLRSIAGIENLGDRISEFALTAKNGRIIPVKKLIPGEYLAEDFAVGFSYKVDLTVKKNFSSMAHISWLKDDKGLLMLDDLLPQFGQNVGANIRFELPEGFGIEGNETKTGQKSFEVADIEKAVFLVGSNWRGKDTLFGNKRLSLVISGQWQFSDEEAGTAASEILHEYEKIFAEIPNEKSQVYLLKFPVEMIPGNWEAETRGANVVILSSDMPFKSQSVQRLHEQLRHELFHFWIPNNLALSGNYAWFYEGFALYQSLRTGVGLNRIRFEDFLDTLSRAYDLDSFQSQRISLIEASKNRWNGTNSQIYARGMLVAFLCDIALLSESKGKNSLTEIFRGIYQKHRKPNAVQDANGAILSLLESFKNLRPITEKYVKGTENIAWQTYLEAVGIEAKEENSFTKLSVKSKLNGRQKDLLNELGYNNWRKIVQKTK